MSRETERKDKTLRRFYTVGEVEAITTLSRSTIYRRMAQGSFPKAVEISAGRVGWDKRSIDDWCNARLAGDRD
jgi:prophage regulatory protein